MVEVKPPTSYYTLTTLLREIDTLSDALFCLKWDEWVMMPSGSAGHRAEQTATLAAVIHEKSTSDAIATAIAEAERDLGGNVRYARRMYEQEVHVPC